MTNSSNPLTKYFRVPGVTVELPTRGAFFPEGMFDQHADRVDVYPMRAADELLMKNPDALMSGFAIEQLIQSCVPAIRAPKLVSSPDLDVLLLAIRAATYGEIMEIQAVCPKCRHENTFDCNLGTIIENVKPVPAEHAVRLTGDLIAYVRPYNLADTTGLSNATFAETRKVQALEAEDGVSDAAKTAQMNASMAVLAKLSGDLTSRCVVKIVTPEGVVEDPEHIREFFSNVSRQWTHKIETKITDLNNAGIDKTIHVQCERVDCKNEWETAVEFDPANFFDSGSSD